MHSDDNRLPATTTQADMLALIDKCNKDSTIHGILVQTSVTQAYQR